VSSRGWSICRSPTSRLGLANETSFIYTSYAVEDDWPFDLQELPGSPGRFDHGFIPPKLFAAVIADFAAHLRNRPDAIHRRDG